MTSRRLKRRGWMQYQTIQVLTDAHGDEFDAATILHLITRANPSEARRGWCKLSPVSLGQMLRQLVAKGILVRDLQSSGIYSYRLATEDYEVRLKEFLSTVVMYQDGRKQPDRGPSEAVESSKDPDPPLDP